MGFVSDILNGKLGLAVYSIVGIIIFVGLFIVILVRTKNMSKTDIKAYKESILESDETYSEYN